ncbi:YesL family protein [Pontibacillus marinus]|uniref:DUF624 domain-containing protein n=1 Tax=Pontibacillus marinus BH030004 = DSM 16465 TaxID=1385511 RepID=A0A0A5HLT4_9BACI|nr:DUF624 domain-containing protein [Pontibacillus marinus]KGX84572.1 hypothetical protein N783_16675 [Pontibacillus marinus BH030004 = DSM 16465]
MQFHGFLGVFNRISIWIMRLAYLNLLWILFTIIGLILFGMGPSTISVFVIIRKMLNREEEIKVFNVFKVHYKKYFLTGNMLFIIFIAIGFIFYFDANLFIQYNHIIYQYIAIVFYILTFWCGLSIIYVGPMFTHYNMRFFDYIKYSSLFPFFAPFQTLIILLGILGSNLLFTFLPGLLPFFFISLPAFIISVFAFQGFRKLEEKRAQSKQLLRNL